MKHLFHGLPAYLAVLLLPALLLADDKASEPVDLEKIFAGGEPTTVAELRAMEDHIKELTRKLVPSTVGVRVGQAQGSGVIISEDGYVLTAAHVNGRPGREVTFIFADGKTAKGKTLGVNRDIDAGLMKIEDKGKKWPFVEQGDSKSLKLGQWVVSTGHPGGYQRGRPPVVRVGRVLTQRDNVIATDCTLVGGDSGGPLFDMDGKVVGIHSQIGGTLASNMHVPVKTYKDTWDRLVKGEAWGGASGAYIGVQADPEAKNARIAQVVPGTPAAKAGLKEGDVITKFAGRDVTDFPSLSAAVRDKKPGDKVKIEIQRGEDKLTLDMTLGRRGG